MCLINFNNAKGTTSSLTQSCLKLSFILNCGITDITNNSFLSMLQDCTQLINIDLTANPICDVHEDLETITDFVSQMMKISNKLEMNV